MQLEGQIHTLTEQSKKYKEDANSLLKQSMERTSDLRKEDAMKTDKIRTLEEAVAAQTVQIEDYTA
jgi:hypothetical protein